jgi:Lrp/AsnC family transcriptional regulator of ectoine degradation
MVTAIELDNHDLQILKIVQDHGDISNQELAARISLSPSACLNRVRRLEKAGVIRRYLAELDLGRLRSYLLVWAEVTLVQHGTEEFRRFDKAMSDLPEVVETYQVNGAFDYLIRVACRDINHYREVNDRLSAAGLGIARIQSHIVMSRPKAFSGYDLSAFLE